MLRNRRSIKLLGLAVLLAAVHFVAPIIPAVAAPPLMPAVGSAVFPLTFHISGAKTTTTTNVVSYVAPFAMRVLYMTAVADAKAGTHLSSHGRSSLIVKNAGTNITAGVGTPAGPGLAVAVPAAGTATETNASSVSGTIMTAAQRNIASGAAVTADLQLWGSSPSITDISFVMWVQRQ